MSRHQSVSRHHSSHSRSRHQNQVAILLKDTLCRDINFMSRPRFRPQWDFQVATPKSMSRPPTPPPMSRHQLHVATPFPPSQSRPGRDATSWSRPHAAPQGFLHVATKANQSQPQPNQVATSNLGRDSTLEFGSSHSSFCLAPIFFLFFYFSSNPPVAFLLLLRCSSLNTAIHTTSNIFINIILFNFLQFYPVKP